VIVPMGTPPTETVLPEMLTVPLWLNRSTSSPGLPLAPIETLRLPPLKSGLSGSVTVALPSSSSGTAPPPSV
jgi:hypothetical protein